MPLSGAPVAQAERILGYSRAPSQGPIPAGILDDARIIAGSVHPDTGLTIHPALRLASFLPINVTICAGILAPGLSTAASVFWQGTNQVYNLSLTYAQRNATGADLSNTQLGLTAIAAVGAAGGITAVGRTLLARAGAGSGFAHTSARMLVPLLSVQGGGVAVTYLMRSRELKDGITVERADGTPLTEYGPSQVAASNAVFQTAMSRCALAFAPILIPQLGKHLLTTKVAFFKNRPRTHGPLGLALITAGLWVGLPIASAIFPQRASTPIAAMEPRFAEAGVDRVYYNKGL